MTGAGLGRWVTDFRFEFDPPLETAPEAATQQIRAFDLTPLADSVPDLVDQRERLLDQFVWELLLQIDL